MMNARQKRRRWRQAINHDNFRHFIRRQVLFTATVMGNDRHREEIVKKRPEIFAEFWSEIQIRFVARITDNSCVISICCKKRNACYSPR
jgi:hypothetical protein